MDADDKLQLDTRRAKDGRSWRIGGAAEVAWIGAQTATGLSITAAIPPIFEAYATLEHPGSGHHDPIASHVEYEWHAGAVLEVLTAETAPQPWWLGYLDYGIGAETVFHDVAPVALYNGGYVLIEAGPVQAASWRSGRHWKGPLPDVMFPAERSWLFCTLWDDDWSCLGAGEALIDRLCRHPRLRDRTRRVEASRADATPPGHDAR